MDPDPTPELTPFFSDFKDAKILIFFYFASLQALFQKMEGSGSGSVPVPLSLTNGSWSWRPTNIRIRIPNIGIYVQF